MGVVSFGVVSFGVVSFVNYWRGEISRNWFLPLPIIAFLVSVGMNVVTGYKEAGLALAAVLFSVAIMTTYAGTVGPRGGSWRAALLMLFLPFGLAIDQMAVWQSLGISMADGQVERERQASTGETLAAKLERFRAERRALGDQRPVASIEAEEKLECSITSARYPTGEGPKCTALRAELGAAKRAVELDETLIPGLLKQIAETPAAAGGAPNYQVPLAFAQAGLDALYGPGKITVSAGDVQFGFLVLLAVVISFLANLGFWLVGYDPLHGQQGNSPVEPAWKHGRSRHDGGGGPGGGGHHGRWSDELVHAIDEDEGVRPAQPVNVARAALPAPEKRAALSGDRDRVDSQHHIAQHGSPIHVHFNSGFDGQQRSTAVEPVTERGPASLDDAGETAQHAAAMLTREKIAMPATPDAPPVDRSRMARQFSPAEREAADVIASFAAACILDAPGGLVSLDVLYQRYAHWAGDKALTAPVFAALLPDVTGCQIEEIGGFPHVVGVSLRAGASLEAVG